MKVKISKNLTFSYKERPKIIAEISGIIMDQKKIFKTYKRVNYIRRRFN